MALVICLLCRRVNIEGTEKCIGCGEALSHYIVQKES